MPGFPWTSLHVPFSFADFVVYIFFAVINHNPGYNYVPRPVSPPSKLLNLAVVCGLREPPAQKLTCRVGSLALLFYVCVSYIMINI